MSAEKITSHEPKAVKPMKMKAAAENRYNQFFYLVVMLSYSILNQRLHQPIKGFVIIKKNEKYYQTDMCNKIKIIRLKSFYHIPIPKISHN